MEKKKISFDLHGVINDLPKVIGLITSALIKDDWEVHIITGSVTQRAYEELTEFGLVQGINFTHVVGLPDYCLMKGFKVLNSNDKFKTHEVSSDDWNSAKAMYCEENKILLHMDDKLEYEEFFKTTAFARLYTNHKK